MSQWPQTANRQHVMYNEADTWWKNGRLVQLCHRGDYCGIALSHSLTDLMNWDTSTTDRRFNCFGLMDQRKSCTHVLRSTFVTMVTKWFTLIFYISLIQIINRLDYRLLNRNKSYETMISSPYRLNSYNQIKVFLDITWKSLRHQLYCSKTLNLSFNNLVFVVMATVMEVS